MESDSITREVLFQIDVIALKLAQNGSFESDSLSKLYSSDGDVCYMKYFEPCMHYFLGMNLFDLQPGGGDIRGVADEGNSIDLPTNELLAAVGESSGT